MVRFAVTGVIGKRIASIEPAIFRRQCQILLVRSIDIQTQRGCQASSILGVWNAVANGHRICRVHQSKFNILSLCFQLDRLAP